MGVGAPELSRVVSPWLAHGTQAALGGTAEATGRSPGSRAAAVKIRKTRSHFLTTSQRNRDRDGLLLPNLLVFFLKI